MGEVPSSLLSVQDAQQRLLTQFARLETEQVPLESTSGRVLAEPVAAPYDLPPFSNSSMDGFAVRAADVRTASTSHPSRLSVIADIPAGQASSIVISKGEAARIMTGAVLPPGADAVVPVEDTDFNHRQPGMPPPAQVDIYIPAHQGDNVRPRGQDLPVGAVVLPAGHRLRPVDIGFLSMLGIALVPVVRRPRMAVFSTGDELLPPGEPLSPGKIHDANTYTLVSLVKAAGGEPLNLGIAPDQESAVQEILERSAALRADLILSSAGVSVGAFDFVRSVVERQGQLDFWRVNMRPGKPLAFGSFGGIPFIGLPGNPVSAYVGFEVFVRPAIQKMSGVPGEGRSRYRAYLDEPVASDGRESYLRAVLHQQDGRWHARLTGHQGSGNLHSLVQADALIIIPPGVRSLAAGDEVDFWLLHDPGV